MDTMYFVTRVIISTEGAQTQSIQRYDTEVQARKRAYTIIGSDLDKEGISFELVQVVKDNGLCLFSEVIDNRGLTAVVEGAE